LTPEDIEYNEAVKAIDAMEAESQKYNNPENYAKFGKL